MKPGPPTCRRRRLNPKLRIAIRLAMSTGPGGWAIAAAAGFPHYSTFSELLHAPEIAATPLTVARFQRVASIVGFSDEVFLAEELEHEEVGA